jgi:hypothetical protein
METEGRLVKHARYCWLSMAEGHLNRRQFRAMLGRIELLSVATGNGGQVSNGIRLQRVGARRGVAKVAGMAQFRRFWCGISYCRCDPA